jgi:predicted MPP superfamily phosphohydrolase
MNPRQERHRLRILHLSDLHERVELDWMDDERKARVRGHAAQRHRVLGPSLQDVLAELRAKGGPIDLVCFTGDVADWGLPEEYARATPRVKALLGSLGVPLERFFVIPGNHDVQRKQAAEAWSELRTLAGANAPGLSSWMAGMSCSTAINTSPSPSITRTRIETSLWSPPGASTRGTRGIDGTTLPPDRRPPGRRGEAAP